MREQWDEQCVMEEAEWYITKEAHHLSAGARLFKLRPPPEEE